jgi:uncharacterized protein
LGTYSSLALLIGSNIPSAVAIVLTLVGFGKGATRRLLGQLLIWRVGWRWYLVLAPTALVVGTITLVAVTRGGPTAALAVPLLSAIITVAFMTFPGGALGEEIGWRGFALPRLQFRRTALTASLFHTATNAPLTLVLLPLGIQNWVLPFWLMAGFTAAAALVVVAVFGPSRLSRLPKQTQPTTLAEAR